MEKGKEWKRERGSPGVPARPGALRGVLHLGESQQMFDEFLAAYLIDQTRPFLAKMKNGFP